VLKQFIIQFDTSLTAHIQQWPGWFRAPMLVATFIGQPLVLIAAAGTVGLFAWQRSNTGIVFAMGAGLAAMLFNTLVKHFVHRTRPDTLYVSEMWFATSSFPSGHAFGSMVILGLLGYLGAQYLPAPWNIMTPVGLGLLIFIIGVSRIYLGAHFPTDVIAGWVLGACILALIIMLARP
jgi:undecaprenyl-diphosphatase